MTDTATVTASEIRAFVEQFERLEAENSDIAEAQKDVMTDAPERYQPNGNYEPADVWMAADAEGDWVEFKDYLALAARLSDVEAALDGVEKKNSITTNGNVWRFWRDQAREMVSAAKDAKARADVSRAAVEAAYIAGLDVATAWAKTYFLDAGVTADREHTAGKMIAQTLQSLRDNPAHVAAAMARLTSNDPQEG